MMYIVSSIAYIFMECKLQFSFNSLLVASYIYHMYISILIGVGYSCFFTSFDAYIMIGFCLLDGYFTMYRIFLGFGTVPFLTFVLGGKACDVYLNYENYILYIPKWKSCLNF